jgi:hypothetical protein
MLKFIFGFLFGTLVGIFGAFIAWILGMVVLEDSPEARETLNNLTKDR